jgi:hypothetical protein
MKFRHWLAFSAVLSGGAALPIIIVCSWWLGAFLGCYAGVALAVAGEMVPDQHEPDSAN